MANGFYKLGAALGGAGRSDPTMELNAQNIASRMAQSMYEAKKAREQDQYRNQFVRDYLLQHANDPNAQLAISSIMGGLGQQYAQEALASGRELHNKYYQNLNTTAPDVGQPGGPTLEQFNIQKSAQGGGFAPLPYAVQDHTDINRYSGGTAPTSIGQAMANDYNSKAQGRPIYKQLSNGQYVMLHGNVAQPVVTRSGGAYQGPSPAQNNLTPNEKQRLANDEYKLKWQKAYGQPVEGAPSIKAWTNYLYPNTYPGVIPYPLSQKAKLYPKNADVRKAYQGGKLTLEEAQKILSIRGGVKPTQNTNGTHGTVKIGSKTYSINHDSKGDYIIFDGQKRYRQ